MPNVFKLIIFVSFDTFVQFIFDVDLLGNKVDYSHAWRLSGPFGSDILWVVIYFVWLLGLAIFRYVYKINKAIEIIYIICYLLQFLLQVREMLF